MGKWDNKKLIVFFVGGTWAVTFSFRFETKKNASGQSGVWNGGYKENLIGQNPKSSKKHGQNEKAS